MMKPGLFRSLVLILSLLSPALADTPATSVNTTPVNSGGAYASVPPGGEAWFDVGGYCKVVDVTAASPAAVPVFVNGPPDQWENDRQMAVSKPQAGVSYTTCCRPKGAITTLCAGTATPVSVSRAYGKNGESDTVSATCTGPYGQYTESANIACSGDNGPDGQANWAQSGSPTDICSPNAFTSACSATCGGGSTATGSQTTYDSCGNVQSVKSCSISCCTNNWQTTVGSCQGQCGGHPGTQTVTTRNLGTCGGSSSYQQSCTTGACALTAVAGASCDPFPVGGQGCGGPTSCYDGPGCAYGCGNDPPNYHTTSQYGRCSYGISSWRCWGNYTGAYDNCSCPPGTVQTTYTYCTTCDYTNGATIGFTCWAYE